MPITDDMLEGIVKAIEKKKLAVTIHRGDEVEDVYRIPFLSPNMNYATEGGAPIGRFSLFWGPQSSFKSRAAYELIAQAQNLYEASEKALYPRIKLYEFEGDKERAKRLTEELEFIQGTWPDGLEVAFYNAEQQYDKAWAAKLGIDTHRILLVGSQVIEDIADTMEGLFSTVDMHVIDSTSNAMSTQEANSKKTDSLYGPDARAWKRSLRDAMRHFDPQRNVGLLINQASTRVSGPGAGGDIPVSTRFLMHTSSMTLRFQLARFLYKVDDVLVAEKPDGADKVSLAGRVPAAGREVFATVEKSRVCSPFKIAAMHARFGAKTFDHLWELTNAAVWLGVATQVPGHRWIIEGDPEDKHHGMKRLQDRVANDEELQGRIYARLMHTLEDDDLVAPTEDVLGEGEESAAA